MVADQRGGDASRPDAPSYNQAIKTVSAALGKLKLSAEEEKAWKVIQESLGRAPERRSKGDKVDALQRGLDDLTRAVAELSKGKQTELNARKSHAKTGTWAQVATRAERFAPTPAHKQKQVIVGGGGSREANSSKTATQVAVALSGGEGQGLHARKLPNGMFALSFPSVEARKAWVGVNQGKVQEVLGVGAGIREHTFDVIVSGFPAGTIGDSSEELRISSIVGANPALKGVVKRAGALKASKWRSTETLVLGFESPESANEAISRGVYWKQCLLKAEPFIKGVRVTRCYKCQSYGHMASRCKREAKCGWCAEPGHSTEECPRRGQRQAKACANCDTKSHCALDPGCPVRLREEAKAKAAYNARPRWFNKPLSRESTAARPQESGRAPSVPLPSADDEGFVTVGAKRKRAPGRPTTLSSASTGDMPSIANYLVRSSGLVEREVDLSREDEAMIDSQLNEC